MFKVLVSRVVIFTAATLWVVGWLTVGILGLEVLTAKLSTFSPAWVAYLLQIWYIITIVLVGVWAAIKGFKFVGRWERDDKNPDK